MSKEVLEIIVIMMTFANQNFPSLLQLQANCLTQHDFHDYNNLQDYNEQRQQHPSNSGSYAFGYDIEDSETSNVQYKREERHDNGSVTGSYGYLQPDGNVQKVNYVADEYGYRASVQIIPRGVLKPIQIFRPETHLFDFSSNLPAYRSAQIQKPVYKQEELAPVQLKLQNPGYKSVQTSLVGTNVPTNAGNVNKNEGFSNVPYPYNIPKYITKPLAKPNYRMEKGFVPYFPEKQRNVNLHRNLLKDYYVIPLH